MAGYFSFYPSAVYQSKFVTDLIVRNKIQDTWFNNPKLYYQYVYKDGDRPEHLALKYYGSETLHWLILFCNNIFDVHWELPMTYDVFNEYIENKYKDLGAAEDKTGIEYAQTTLDPTFKYQKKIKTVNSDGTIERYYVVDEKTYYNLTLTPMVYSTGFVNVKNVTTEADSDEIYISDGFGISTGDIISGNVNIPVNTRIKSKTGQNIFIITNPAISTGQLEKTFITSIYDGATIYEESRRFPQLTIYDRELEDNEAKRKIKILNKIYVNQAITEFVKLLKQY